MAGEFHHNIRSDAIGEGEADEGFTTGVGANLGPFGIDVIVADTVPVEGNMDWRVEFANLAEVLQAAVHLLVGHVRKGFVSSEVLVFVFVQDGNGVLVQEDGQAVVGFLGGDSEDAIADVGAADTLAFGCNLPTIRAV